ncbi:MAG: DUF6702 family protein [Maribacter sp.]
MKSLKRLLFLAVLPLFAFVTVHKFYISVTNVDYSEKDKAVQIITRIFVNDMNSVLTERYGVETKLGTDRETKVDSEYLEKYLRAKFVVEINGKTVPYNLIGKKYDTDMIILYLEVPKIELKNLSSIAVENEILTDLYDEQQNVVHFKIDGKKKSYVLVKSDTKGMLNL